MLSKPNQSNQQNPDFLKLQYPCQNFPPGLQTVAQNQAKQEFLQKHGLQKTKQKPTAKKSF